MSGDPKFSHIAALRPPADLVKPPGSATGDERHSRLEELLGAELRCTSRGRHLRITCRFPSPGPCAIGPRAQRLLAPRSGPEAIDPGRWLFLDTETTGLAGGTGTYAFLVGIGWWEQDSFVVEQLFMRDHSEEASLLLDLSQRLAERPVLVTFNGKSFDWPLLETRYRMTRAARVQSPSVHLDLLHPARRLWRFRLKSVALSELEKHVLDLERGYDIPSHTIPARYFDFLRGGAAEPIVEVFRHNQMDLCGLAALAVRISNLLEGPENCAGDASAAFGVSRMLHRCGEEAMAEAGYRRALTFGLPQEADRMARRELAHLARRQGDHARANALWETLLGDSSDGIHAYEQLAIHYEHRARDPQRALTLVREALVRLREGNLAGHIAPQQHHRWHAAFRHRLGRLQARIGQQSADDDQ
jgi:tetratricopeptide (TPR) repeat protein